MDQTGLLNWANSIRLTMASDPGRQVFKDQVQTHGFMFLEDYLDNIVSGAKADPLIELVKTPGRKKAIARKPKLMSSKLANNIFFEDNTSSENQAPVPANSFQAALESVQHQKVASEAHKGNKSSTPWEPAVPEKPQRSPFAPVQPLESTSIASPIHSLPPISIPSIPVEQTVEQPNIEHNDLSVIAEDEEPSERSRMDISSRVIRGETLSITPSNVAEKLASPSHLSNQQQSNEDIPDRSMEDIDITATSSVDTFHSIPLNSSPRDTKKTEDPPQTREHSEKPIPGPADDRPSELLPTSSATEIQDYLMEDPLEEEETAPIELKHNEKPTVPSFPHLPEPMPLRKSMRPPRDPSLNTVMMGAATPGAPVGGKRTSWLMKAREVKALEGPAKKSLAPAFNLNPTPGQTLGQGTKRKSEDTNPTTPTAVQDGERQQKVAKAHEGESASRQPKDMHPVKMHDQPAQKNAVPPEETYEQEHSMEQGVLDRLKKTVEGLGVRVTKTMNKSVGGGAATALAEARAAAEARVAERDRKEVEMTIAINLPTVVDVEKSAGKTTKEASMAENRRNEGRLSISDLFPTDSRIKEKHKVPDKPFQFTPSFVPTSTKKNKDNMLVRERTSTTPIHSPPSQAKNRPIPPAPVFNKPPPVFVPPAPAPAPEAVPTSTSVFSSVFNPPPASKYTMPPSMALRFSPHTGSPSSSTKAQKAAPLTAQSTMESIQSNIFDRDDDTEWAPGTQDTEYTYQSQSQPQETQICDEDDSWPVDEKLAAGVQWTYGASKEDSMTWSTLPSQSQRADTGPMTRISPIQEKANERAGTGHARHASDLDMANREDLDEDFERRDHELEDIIMGSSKATVALVEPKIPRSQSQMSMASSESSQSQVGFLGQASKLLSSALGTGKKKQPEVKKVLQMAASAAKKQQEEADKKAARLKEMEHRRQLALQRKVEEEKAKAIEEERKMKEETERRKKEKEDMTDKRAIKASTSKREEDTSKKAKLEPEKKQETKKPVIGKSHLKGVLKQPSSSNLHSSFAFGSSAQPPAGAESSTSLQKGKGVAQPPPMDDELSQPSLLVQSQMAARAKAQIDASKQAEPRIASENIELPDINSEYSDSEDEDRVRTFDPPEWAQSPELRTALDAQSTINPDDIFGAVRPLRMEEIFKTKTSRFRPRSSSANWTGTDRLTLQEEKEYARRMGFKS